MVQTAERSPVLPEQFQQALLESRQRWRDFGTVAADIVFELDGAGRLQFLAPDRVLGWQAEELLGRPAAGLLWAEAECGALPGAARRQRKSWVRRADGEETCLSIGLLPQFDAAGACIRVRGVGVDITARERREQLHAAALRRADVLDHLLDRMRQEVLAPRMMAAILAALLRAIGGSGAAVLDLADPPALAACLHAAGAGLKELQPQLLQVLRDGSSPDPRVHFVQDQQALACPLSTRFGVEGALVLWRPAGAPAWEEDDCVLVASAAGLVRIVLEHECIQRELARQTRTDPLTGLLNRRAFLEEVRRRIDRLERDELPGTVIVIDLDHFKLLNERLGTDVGDAALAQTAAILRGMVRPMDLVARLGGDEFAVWLDGFDQLTAAERAETLRLSYPDVMRQLTEGQGFGLGLSIGIACRHAGSGEELDDLMQRAERALHDVKREGRGAWRVSQRQQTA